MLISNNTNKILLLMLFCVEINSMHPFYNQGDNMSIIKWRPFDVFENFEKEMNQGFDLAVDMYEENNNIIVKMNAPGIDADNMKIEVHDRHLHISGKREEKKEEKDKDYYRKEIRSGSFDRVVSLPCPVNDAGVTAELADGVLKVVLPKASEEEKKAKAIKVIRK